MKNEQTSNTMKVYTIKISNDLTGRLDYLECPSTALRAKVASDYLTSLTKYVSYQSTSIDYDAKENHVIAYFDGGKQVRFTFGSKQA